MEKKIVNSIVGAMSSYLRNTLRESIYRTSHESGLRAEVINRIESGSGGGSAGSLASYIDSFCNRFPSQSYRILYGAILYITQSELKFNQK